MKWRWFVVLFVLLLPACQSQDAGSRFSSNVPAATFAPGGLQPVTLTVTELAETPTAYAGQIVQVTGAYERLPVLVCDTETQPSPVTWRIRDGGAQIGATGYDNLLRRLLPDGSEITVAGRWLRWAGPVGCGKGAPRQELWYLETQEIIAPMPLARLPATPGGAPAAGGEPLEAATENPTATLAPVLSPTATGTNPAGAPGQTPTPTITPALPTVRASATPSALTSGTSTPTVTPRASASPTPDAGTATATITTTLPTATATPSPTATETGPQPTVVNRGNVSEMPLMELSEFPNLALALDRVGEEEAHEWQFNVQAGDVITVSAVAGPQADLRLDIRNRAGETLTSQNSAPAGSVEVIEGLEAGSSGTLRIIVQEANREAAFYALLVDSSAYTGDVVYNLAGLLRYNQGQDASLPAENDHIWVFPGEAGDTVSINLAPRGPSDLIFHFYGPTGDRLLDAYRNDHGRSQSEFLLNYTLQDDGLYAVHVGEFDYGAANYTVTVSGQ